ncbi:MAG: hypothetical protein J6B50_10330 [Lachnospiraceae bacterium]|nr:hypothetical protein [Lachnospiraceae bacterium]
MKEERLFIPRGMKAETEWFEGFGKKELRRAIWGTLGIVFVALMLWLICDQRIYVVVALIFGETGVIAMVTRSSVTNLSGVDHVCLALRFFREQQRYLYKQRKEE